MTDRRSELPPRAVDRGVNGWVLLFAIGVSSAAYSRGLHSWLAAALAVPEMAGEAYRLMLLILNLVVLWIAFSARPARPGHWWLMAAAAAVYQTVATLAWWGAVVLLLYLKPELRMSLLIGLLALTTGAAAGWLAFRAVHRLAGAHSPWHDADDAMTGAPPA
jgi:hypothetical protein